MRSFQFGNYFFDASKGALFLNGAPIHLRHKTALVLQNLLENHSRIVTKEELLDRVWKDTAVADKSLVQAVQELRKLLSDSPRMARYIKTYPKRGYQWVFPLVNGGGLAQKLPPAPGKPRQRPIRGAMFVALAVLISLLVIFVGKPLVFEADALLPTSATGPIRVAVLPFENHTGDPNLQWVELGLSHMLETTLGRREGVHVVPFLRLLEKEPAIERDRMALYLPAANLHYAVAVQIGGNRDGFRVRYQVYDQRGSHEARQLNVPDLLASLPLIARELARDIGLEDGPDVSSFSLVSDANRDFAKGVQAMNGQGMALAKHYFQAALLHDPKFTAAKLSLAEVLAAQGDLAASALQYRQIIDQAEPDPGTDDPMAYFGLAGLLIEQGELKQAKEWTHRGLQLAEDGNHIASQARGLRTLGTVYDILGASKKRQELFAQAYELTGDRRDPESLAKNLYYLSSWNGPGEDLVKNRNLLEMASTHFERLGNRRELASSYLALGHNLSVPNSRRQAYFLSSLQIYQSLGDQTGVLNAKTGLGIFYLSQLQGERAARFLNEAGDMARAHGSNLDVAFLTYLDGISHLYRFREKPGSPALLHEAQARMARSRDLYNKMGIYMRAAAAEMFVGLANHYQGNSAIAIEKVQNSIPALEHLENQELPSMARVILATLFMDGSQWREALPLLKEAMARYQDRSLMVLKYQARCLYELQRYKLARETMENARQLAKNHWREDEAARLQVYRLSEQDGSHQALDSEPGFLVTYWDVR